jgi:hypothetical protein
MKISSRDYVSYHLTVIADFRMIYSKWLTMISDYSYRNLTYNDDKLPAVSGLANAFAEYLPSDEYLAGIWKNDIWNGLCWKVYNRKSLGQSNGQLVKTYRAPSWSWSSIDHPIAFHSLQQFDLGVSNASIQPMGSDHYGKVLEASLEVRGKLKSIAVQQFCPHKYRTSLGNLHVDRPEDMEEFDSCLNAQSLGIVLDLLLLGYEHYKVQLSADEAFKFEEAVTHFGHMGHGGEYLMPEGAYFESLDDIPKEKRDRKFAWERPWCVLVIQKVLDQEDDIRYRRIGLLNGSDLEGTDFFEGCDKRDLILI